MVLCMRLFRSLLLVLSLSLLSMSKVFSPSFLEGVSLLHYQLLSREVLCSQKRRYFLRFREHEAEVERETRATEEDACLKNAKKNGACSAGYYEVPVSKTLSFSKRVMKIYSHFKLWFRC